MALVRKFRYLSEIQPDRLVYLCACGCLSHVDVKYKATEGRICRGSPPCHGDSARSQPEPQGGAGTLTVGASILCVAVYFGLVFPAPARAPDSGFFGYPLWGGAFLLLSSKNCCGPWLLRIKKKFFGILRHVTSQFPRLHLVVRYFLVLVPHTTGFTFFFFFFF